MKLKSIFILSFVILNLSSVSLGYAKENADQTKLVEEVFTLSGMDTQIELIPDQVKYGFSQSSDQLPKELYEEILGIIDGAYNSSEIRKQVLADLIASYDKKKMTIVRDHLKTPLVKKLTELELSASDISQFDAMVQFIDSLEDNEPSNERMEIINRLDVAIDASEITTKMALLSQRVVMRAINSVMPKEQQLSDEQLGQFENDFWVSSRDPIKENVLMTLLFAYRDVSDEDLNTYLKILESEDGQWFYQTLNSAFMASMEGTTKNFGEAFQVTFKKFFDEAQAEALAAEQAQLENLEIQTGMQK